MSCFQDLYRQLEGQHMNLVGSDKDNSRKCLEVDDMDEARDKEREIEKTGKDINIQKEKAISPDLWTLTLQVTRLVA